MNFKDKFRGYTALMWSCFRGDTKVVTLLVRYYWMLLTMNSEEKLTYLCQFDKKFRADAENFLLTLKRNERETGFRIPKYLKFELLLEVWRQAHLTDYRCDLWFGTLEEKIKALRAFIDIKNKQDKTALILAQEDTYLGPSLALHRKSIVTFLTGFETALSKGKNAVRKFLRVHAEKR